MVGVDNNEVVTDINEVIRYIKANKQVSNVLLSGGDALMLTNAEIDEYLEALCNIPQLNFVRLGTRIPVVLPSRIIDDKQLIAIFRKYAEKNVFVLLRR